MKRWLTAAVLLAAWAGCGDDPPATTPFAPSEGGGGAGGTTTVSTSGVVSVGIGGARPELPDRFVVTGTVTDRAGAPIVDAFVVQGGRTEAAVRTDAEGSFELEVFYDGLTTPVVVATQEGYRSWGLEIEDPDEPLAYSLFAAESSDNPDYAYAPPGEGDDPTTAFCGHCHNTFAKQFQTSKHSAAASNPLVQDVYAGVASAITTQLACTDVGGRWRLGEEPGSPGNAAFRCYIGAGTLPDLNPTCGDTGQDRCDDPTIAAADAPTAFGACADCHAPGIAGSLGGRDLLEAEGLAYDEGVFCDVCHKVAEVDLTAAPGVAGALEVRRPGTSMNGQPFFIMYGPLLDVANPFMGGSYQPQFSEATFCAGCHQQRQGALVPGTSLDASRWPDGLPIHTTYEEWQGSAYGASGTPCQHCHMPPETSIQGSADLATPEFAGIAAGFPRPPTQIRQHTFRGPLYGDDRLLDGAAFLTLTPTVATELDLDVAVSNIGCGHALPTGEPMRALVLVVETDACGSPLAVLDGRTVDDLGGALATGTVGADVSASGTVVTWPDGADVATAGQVVRVVRPTGSFEDYPGIGFFADPGLIPADKGRPQRRFVGEASVMSVASGDLTLDQTLALQPGDIVYLGEPLTLGDGIPAAAYAGVLGTTFGKVLVDASGARRVPHHAAVDVVSDNRIPPGQLDTANYSFALPNGCSSATITATLLYRPHPLLDGRRRGWDPRDHLVTQRSVTVNW